MLTMSPRFREMLHEAMVEEEINKKLPSYRLSNALEDFIDVASDMVSDFLDDGPKDVVRIPKRFRRSPEQERARQQVIALSESIFKGNVKVVGYPV